MTSLGDVYTHYPDESTNGCEYRVASYYSSMTYLWQFSIDLHARCPVYFHRFLGIENAIVPSESRFDDSPIAFRFDRYYTVRR